MDFEPSLQNTIRDNNVCSMQLEITPCQKALFFIKVPSMVKILRMTPGRCVVRRRRAADGPLMYVKLPSKK